jgi:phage baseplate assembly protein W
MRKRVENRFSPVDLDKDIAVGVMLPYGKNGGLFKSSYTTEEQAISNLKSLLLTRKGERPFQPDFGSFSYDVLFDQMGENLASELDILIREDIGTWLPYIIIDKLDVDIDYDGNRINVSLNFRVTEHGANTEIKVFIDGAGISVIE